MTIHLDHLMVPSRDKAASAKPVAELLGVPWSKTSVGPFAAVYMNDGLTLDFDEWTDPFPLLHDGHQWEMLTVSYARQAQ